MGVVESVPEKSVHEFIVKDYRGKDVDLSIYKGKVLLIVNVATKCGFTNIQLPQLTELYRKYKDQGFQVLAFPCNQFLKQSPGSSEKTRKVACDRFKAEYPVFRKVCVNGPKTPPLYKFLKASKINGETKWANRVKWNFTKFLIDVDGQVIYRRGLTTAPFKMERQIVKALEERAARQQIMY
ncbi:probable glutathione peroxidase 4 [Chenopodium quinoa]|uniref:probable glutathione peroxidase 4 n=1 Tax=Chenopodium quinoa TaxID=63459 RepID=UPI000B76E307|nr:probable glutathione peroxidase 4 [Chenopodium quinoa]